MWIESLENRCLFSSISLASNPAQPADRSIRLRLLQHRPPQLTAMVTGDYIGYVGTSEAGAGAAAGFPLTVYVNIQSPGGMVGELEIDHEGSSALAFDAGISRFKKQGPLGPGWYFPLIGVYPGLRIQGVFEANSYAMKLQVSGPLVKHIPKAERTVVMYGDVYRV